MRKFRYQLVYTSIQLFLFDFFKQILIKKKTNGKKKQNINLS